MGIYVAAMKCRKLENTVNKMFPGNVCMGSLGKYLVLCVGVMVKLHIAETPWKLKRKVKYH